jgi:hypothetical protein
MSTATPNAHVPSASSAANPMAPRIAACNPDMRKTLVQAYHQAYRWALGTRRWLARLMSHADARKRWNNGSAARLFGPYALARVRRVFLVFEGLLQRFHRGYEIAGRQVAPTLACFPESYHRCRNGLLGNASIFGTIRLCPRSLARGPLQAAMVVLHELMHQGLGVDDQRHQACNGSKHRCYRENARELVHENRYDLAVRNIDNYVAFARLVAGAA